MFLNLRIVQNSSKEFNPMWSPLTSSTCYQNATALAPVKPASYQNAGGIAPVNPTCYQNAGGLAPVKPASYHSGVVPWNQLLNSNTKPYSYTPRDLHTSYNRSGDLHTSNMLPDGTSSTYPNHVVNTFQNDIIG